MKRSCRTCSRSGCDLAPYLGGLCKTHNAEHDREQAKRTRALDALRFRLPDSAVRSTGELADDWSTLRSRWNRVCDVVNGQHGTKQLPLNEAEYAMDWCIALAKELLDAEDTLAMGNKLSSSLEIARGWVNERFENLELGLMSNGRPRSED